MGIIKGSRVSWKTSMGAIGFGEVVTEPQDGKVLVAVDAPAGEPHPVIHCTVTWLSVA